MNCSSWDEFILVTQRDFAQNPAEDSAPKNLTKRQVSGVKIDFFP
jgi:hypothetical protein